MTMRTRPPTNSVVEKTCCVECVCMVTGGTGIRGARTWSTSVLKTEHQSKYGILQIQWLVAIITRNI